MKINQIVKTLGATNKKSKTSAYDTPAEVVRVEGSTVYVHIPGGVDETPVRKTINCQKGDMVQVRVGNGTAWITGNVTAPPTDDRAAKTVDLKVDKVASGLKRTVEATNEINKIVETTNQHFWSDDNGIHISYQTQEDYNDGISGANLLANANGLLFRNGEDVLAGMSPNLIWLGNSTNFSVNSSGHLTAKSANISGVLTAGSGSSIGGWTAYTSRLESDYTGSGGKRSGMQNGTTYVASSAVFYAGCSTAAGDPIADPSKTNWFVRQDGTMYGKTAYLGYTGVDENQYVYVNNAGLTAYVMSSGSGTLQAVSVATLRGSVTYPSGIEKPTGTLNLGGAYISGTYARDEGLYKFTTNATFSTLRADTLNVGGNKPITMRIIKKTNQSIGAAPTSGYVGTGKAFVFNTNTPSGYRLVGCTVVNTNHAAACKIGAFYTDAEADTITVYLVNQATSAITDLQINIRAIYFAEGASSVMAEATG